MNVHEEALGLLKMAKADGRFVLLPPGQVSLNGEMLAWGWLKRAGLIRDGRRWWSPKIGVYAGKVLAEVVERQEAQQTAQGGQFEMQGEQGVKKKAAGSRQQAAGPEASEEVASSQEPGEGQSAICNPQSAMADVGTFDPANPWPEGSEIVLESADGESSGVAKLLEVDLEAQAITIKQKGEPEFIVISEWNKEWASAVQEVRFPRDGKDGEKCEEEASDSRLQTSGQETAPQLCSSSPQAPTSTLHLPTPRNSDVPLSLIDVVHNVRSKESLFDESLVALGDSISGQGQLETIKVMRTAEGRFRLLDGERRYRSALAGNIQSLRAEVYDEQLSEEQILLFQLTTFASRKDLTHREWSAALADYARRGNMTAAQVARSLGRGDDWVRKHLAFADFEPLVQQMVDGEKLSLNKAITISRLPADQQEATAQKCYLHGWSEQELADQVNELLGQTPQAGGLLGEEAAEEVASSQEPGADPQPQPPADNAWKASHVNTLGMPKAVSDALVAAGLWCAGLVAQFQASHGVNWTKEITGLGEAAQKAVDDAFERLWLGARPARAATATGETPVVPEGATDEHDQVNARRANKIAEAPIKGTAGDTQRQRDQQAKADSDAANRTQQAPMVAGRISVGKCDKLAISASASTAVVSTSNATVVIKIDGKPYTIYGTVRIQTDPASGAMLLKAATKAGKKPGKKK